MDDFNAADPISPLLQRRIDDMTVRELQRKLEQLNEADKMTVRRFAEHIPARWARPRQRAADRQVIARLMFEVW